MPLVKFLLISSRFIGDDIPVHSFDDVPVDDMKDSYVSSLDDMPPHPLDSACCYQRGWRSVLERLWMAKVAVHIEVEAVPKSIGEPHENPIKMMTMLSSAPIEVEGHR